MSEKFDKLVENLEESETIPCASEYQTPADAQAAFVASKPALAAQIAARVNAFANGAPRRYMDDEQFEAVRARLGAGEPVVHGHFTAGGPGVPAATYERYLKAAEVRRLEAGGASLAPGAEVIVDPFNPSLPAKIEPRSLPASATEIEGTFWEAKNQLAQKIQEQKQRDLLKSAVDPEDSTIVEMATAMQMAIRHMARLISRKIAKEAIEAEQKPFEEWIMDRYGHLECTTPFEVVKHLEAKDDLQSQRMRDLDGIEIKLLHQTATIKDLQDMLRDSKTEQARMMRENRLLKEKLGIYGGEQDDTSNTQGSSGGIGGTQINADPMVATGQTEGDPRGTTPDCGGPGSGAETSGGRRQVEQGDWEVALYCEEVDEITGERQIHHLDSFYAAPEKSDSESGDASASYHHYHREENEGSNQENP